MIKDEQIGFHGIINDETTQTVEGYDNNKSKAMNVK